MTIPVLADPALHAQAQKDAKILETTLKNTKAGIGTTTRARSARCSRATPPRSRRATRRSSAPTPSSAARSRSTSSPTRPARSRARRPSPRQGSPICPRLRPASSSTRSNGSSPGVGWPATRGSRRATRSARSENRRGRDRSIGRSIGRHRSADHRSLIDPSTATRSAMQTRSTPSRASSSRACGGAATGR
jgi:hypothetical protein